MMGLLGVRRKRVDISVQHSTGTLEISFNLLFYTMEENGDQNNNFTWKYFLSPNSWSFFLFSIIILFFTPETRCSEVIWPVVNNGFLRPHTYVGLSTMS